MLTVVLALSRTQFDRGVWELLGTSNIQANKHVRTQLQSGKTFVRSLIHNN
jgi:hypothetical protein